MTIFPLANEVVVGRGDGIALRPFQQGGVAGVAVANDDAMQEDRPIEEGGVAGVAVANGDDAMQEGPIEEGGVAVVAVANDDAMQEGPIEEGGVAGVAVVAESRKKHRQVPTSPGLTSIVSTSAEKLAMALVSQKRREDREARLAEVRYTHKENAYATDDCVCDSRYSCKCS